MSGERHRNLYIVKVPLILPGYCFRIIHLLLCPEYLHCPEFSIFVFYCPLTWVPLCHFSTNRNISPFSRPIFNATYSRKFPRFCLPVEINMLVLCSLTVFCYNSLERTPPFPLVRELQRTKCYLE